jgi:hypothetical protein
LDFDEGNVSVEEKDGLNERTTKRKKINNSLLYRLTVSQTSCDRRSRLSDIVALSCNRLGDDSTVMFVSPNHKVDRVIKEALWDVILWTVFNPVFGS